MNNINRIVQRSGLTLTFALSPKGMIMASEIDAKLKPRTKQLLLKMREEAYIELLTNGGKK